jgi:peptide/nickel transport system permease protein
MVLVAIFAPLIAPYSSTTQDLLNTLSAPSAQHVLGTDDLGRDILSRLIYGSRVTLGIGFAASLVSLLLGLAVGATAGYAGRWIDTLLMRFVDLVLSFPRFSYSDPGRLYRCQHRHNHLVHRVL